MLADDFKITISVLEDRGATTNTLHDYKYAGIIVDDYGTPEVWVRGSKSSGQQITLQTHNSNPESADYYLCVKAASGGDSSLTYTAGYALTSMNSSDKVTVDIFSEGLMPGGTTQRIKRKRIGITRE